MLHYIVKVLLTSMIIVGISEIGKRSTVWAATLAALPLTSLLAFVWMYIETGDVSRIAAMSQSIFWLVLVSLPLFLLLPFLLRAGWGFWPSLLSVCLATAVAYAAIGMALGRSA